MMSFSEVVLSVYALIFRLVAFFAIVIPLHAQGEVEKVLAQLTLDEKVGQLFMVAGYVDPTFAESENAPFSLDSFIQSYHVGGIAFVGPSETAKQTAITNHYQSLSKIPLLIAQDLEWGLGMRHADALSFPKNTTLGAIDDNTLIYEMGKEIGRQAKLIGVHINLSPVLDVNTDPENIVINVRSFGSSAEIVATKGTFMIRGLQDAGVIASAKHFPGLGDMRTDPHINLPLSPHDKKRLSQVEFYPFAQAIKEGVLSIQTEHLIVPAIDPHNPASLSHTFVTDILKKELKFNGLILSGALRMSALTKHLSQEEIALKAFQAGSDILLMPQDLPRAYNAIKTALTNGHITEQELDERVLKILQAKERVGLFKEKLVSLPTHDQLHTPTALALKEKLYTKAITLLRGALPTRKKVAYVQLGDASSPIPQDYSFPLDKDPREEVQRLLSQIDAYEHIIISVFPADPRRIVSIRLLDEKNQKEQLKDFKVHGVTESLAQVATLLLPYQEKITIAYFGNPYGLPLFEGYQNLIMAYEADPLAIDSVFAKLLKP